MNANNKKKATQLGMPYGTACGRLRKMVLLRLLKIYNLNICYRCRKKIESEKELSIEHKIPWLDNDIALFWDLDNIAFSHLGCNSRSSRPIKRKVGRPHGCLKYKREGCRCKICKKAKSRENKTRYLPGNCRAVV